MMALVEIYPEEKIIVRGSLYKSNLSGQYRVYVGGKENAVVTNIRMVFNRQEQIDKLIDQLLDIRERLKP